jgi:hypothetical protein
MRKADKWNLGFFSEDKGGSETLVPIYSTTLHCMISRQMKIQKRDDPIIGSQRSWNAKTKVSPMLRIKLSLFLNTMPWRSMTESRPGCALRPIHGQEKSLDIHWRRRWMDIGWQNYHVINNHGKLWNMFGLSAHILVLNELYKSTCLVNSLGAIRLTEFFS